MIRNYRKEYDNFQGKPSQIKKRAKRNAARRKMMKSGMVRKGDGKDVHHINHKPQDNSRKNLRVTSRRKNRSFPRTRTARKARR